MSVVPIAAFLAGSLLSLLLPALLLIALVVWYVGFIKRAPGPGDGSELASPAPDAGKSPAPETGATPNKT